MIYCSGSILGIHKMICATLLCKLIKEWPYSCTYMHTQARKDYALIILSDMKVVENERKD